MTPHENGAGPSHSDNMTPKGATRKKNEIVIPIKSQTMPTNQPNRSSKEGGPCNIHMLYHTPETKFWLWLDKRSG